MFYFITTDGCLFSALSALHVMFMGFQRLKSMLLLQTYLVDNEFETVFGMTKEEFYEQPRWKQELQKKKADLF
jgi:hypothetical protein